MEGNEEKEKERKDKIRRGLARNGTAKHVTHAALFSPVCQWANRSRSARFERRFAVDAVPFGLDNWDAERLCVKNVVLGEPCSLSSLFVLLLLYFCLCSSCAR